jgi:hypothetical protein
MRALVFSIVLVLLAATPAVAKKDGVDSPAYFAPIGCGVGPDGGPDGCHDTSADAALTLTLDGPTSIPTGGSASYMVSLPVGFQGQVGAGVNVAVATDSTASCDLDKLGAANLQFVGGDVGRQATLSHVDATIQPPGGNLGVWSYTFALTNCIVPGTLHLLTAMNAFNGDQDITGDLWNWKSVDVTVPEPREAALAGAALAALAALALRARERSAA